MKLILLGAPGAGKGTQAEFIQAALKVPVISTGNLLREAVAQGNALGLQAKEYMTSGRLVPDELIIALVREKLASHDCEHGVILDGFPRTVAQAEALDTFAAPDAVVSLEVPDEVIVKRMTGRRTCIKCGATYHVVAAPPKQEGICDKCGSVLEQRKDDKPETVKARLVTYHQETEPLKDFYAKRGVLKLSLIHI